LNDYFTNIGQTTPGREIPTVDIDPLLYGNAFNRVFSFKRINVLKVVKLVKGINGGKAIGVDDIPFLTIATIVVAPNRWFATNL